MAEDIASSLFELGWNVTTLGLSSSDPRKIPGHRVFNLCDGDQEDRCGMVSFAEELSDLAKIHSGSHHSALRLCKEKTLSWISSVPVPKWWDLPPSGIKHIVKPRTAHGSLLISEENIDGGVSFSPKEYFFQEYLEGPELTVCFLGDRFLGQSVSRETGIVTRNDKWEAALIKARKPKVWDHTGSELPCVRDLAIAAWAEMQRSQPPGYLSYGTVDIRMNSRGTPFLIDLNPNAYLGRDGNIYSCWSSSGGTFAELVGELSNHLIE